MATTSLVTMTAPRGTTSPDLVILVHYDGDEVGSGLERIIGRDGYPAAHRTFADQPSRLWREVNATAAQSLPDYIARHPQNLLDSEPVEGYGVLFVGKNTLTAEQIGDSINWHRDRTYQVDQDGVVATAG